MILSRLRPLFAAGIPVILDLDSTAKTQFENSGYKEALDKQPGWERVRSIFLVDEFGNYTPQFNSMLQTTFTAAFIGGLYGGVMKSKDAYFNFLDNNQATIFHTTFEAKKKLNTQVSIAFGKGVYQLGWRLGLFTFSFCGLSTALTVYKGKTSISDYTIAGLITGSLFKVTLGLRGLIVGGGLGAILGTIAGCASVLLLRLTNTTIEDVQYWQYQFKSLRLKSQNRAMDRSAKEKHHEYIDHHDQLLGENVPEPGLVDNFAQEENGVNNSNTPNNTSLSNTVTSVTSNTVTSATSNTVTSATNNTVTSAANNTVTNVKSDASSDKINNIDTNKKT